MATTPPDDAAITVIYNGDCPICSREIAVYQRLADREGLPITWADLTREPGLLDAWSLTEDQAARRLYVVDTDKTLLAGVDAFARLWLVLPGFGWLGHLARFPPIRPFAIALYEGVLGPFLFWLHKRRQKRKE
ncbi:MAG: thiol-disulfide oxidoreductase DCC family protein [Alphaproteobacteria bacterium]